MTKEEILERIGSAIDKLEPPLTELEWQERKRLVGRFWEVVWNAVTSPHSE